jgi:hypothetical protein
MLRPGSVTAAAAIGPRVGVAAGVLLGVGTVTPPELSAPAAPVPGIEALTDGIADGMIGNEGIGSSTLPDGMSPVASIPAVAPPAVARRPAAEAVTVALLGSEFIEAGEPTKA